MPKVLIPIATGFEEIEAITIIDVLRRAEVDVFTVCLDRRCVLGAHEVQIKTDGHIDEVKSQEYDMLVLPGGMPGSKHLKNSKKLQEIIGEMDHGGKLIGAICAAPIALAKAHVIKTAYTCYPSFEEEAGKGYIPNEDVVCDQNIITSKGPGAAMIFSLFLVEKLCGTQKAEEIKKQLLFQ